VKGDKIKIEDSERALVPASVENNYLLQAGTATDADGDLVSAGGRVLNVVGSGPDVAAARAAAYELAGTVSFRGGWYRRDIAASEGYTS
jgi:phosphoribosylamine---glycine ligase